MDIPNEKFAITAYIVARHTIQRPNVLHLEEHSGKHGRGARQSREVHQRRGGPYVKAGKLFRAKGEKQG